MIQKKNNNKKINNKKKSHPNLFRLSKRPNINLTEGKQKRKSQIQDKKQKTSIFKKKEIKQAS
jgi:hypothetical protein